MSLPPPPTPIIIEVDEPLIITSSALVSNSENGGIGSTGLTTPVLNLPMFSGGDGGTGKRDEDVSSPKQYPSSASKSLLGADLIPKTASLAMPPPSTSKVKKARNLVNPGMSMVKWMKLQQSRDRPQTRRKIPLSEIAKHNTESDCWMVIRNCVYDVTEYLPYHPGGIPELMKGAGKDATALFNEVHRWVNFDSILKSCLQGYLYADSSFDDEEIDTDRDNIAQRSIVPLSIGKSLSTSVALPSAKFSENEKLLILQVETANLGDDDLSEDNWCVSILNGERFLLKVILKPPELWMAHVKLLQRLNDDTLAVSFQNSFRRAVITFRKPSIGTWKKLGSPLQDNNRLLDSREVEMADSDFSRGTIVEKEQLTRDVFLYGIKTANSAVLGVPVGFHLKLKVPEGLGDLPARKYTPVARKLFTEDDGASSEGQNDEERSKVLYFIMKIYPDGQLTKVFGSLEVNSHVELGKVAGRHDPSFLRDCNTLALFAGGSGITPFVRMATFLRERAETYPIANIILVFFNHTEEDIIWREQWAQLATSWKNFTFAPVVSSASNPEAWTGLTGRVDDASIFKTILTQTFTSEDGVPPANLENEVGKLKAMVCGGCGFNQACVTMLKSKSFAEISVTDEDVFIF